MQIFDDLEAEQTALRSLVADLDEATWQQPSAAADWSIADVMLHLAQTEELVVTALRAGNVRVNITPVVHSLDGAMDELVRSERGAPGAAVLERWDTARTAALDSLRDADPDVAVQWAAAPLRPTTLATTRLAEHWAHALDIAPVLGVGYPDTPRLRHVAWLAHRSLPYAFSLVGEAAPSTRFQLTGPAGEAWSFGPDDAECVVSGTAGELCRLGAQRLSAEQSGLTVTGPHGDRVLALVRNYAA